MKAWGINYGGDGTDNRDITISSGFGTPDFVWIKRFSGITGSFLPYVRTSTMTGDAAKQLGTASTLASNQIQAFGVDTFQVGSSTQTNNNGRTEGYMATRDDGLGGFAVFTYVGDGSSPKTITPGGSFTFSPVIAVVISEGSEDTYWATDKHPAGHSNGFLNGDSATAITGMASGSITVGATLNTSSVQYHVAVWSAGAAEAVTYVGDGTGSKSVSHSLGSLPMYYVGEGLSTTFSSRWEIGNGSGITSARINSNSSIGGISSETDTGFVVANDLNAAGVTYVIMVFGPDIDLSDPPSFTGTMAFTFPAFTMAFVGDWAGYPPGTTVLPPIDSSPGDDTPAPISTNGSTTGGIDSNPSDTGPSEQTVDSNPSDDKLLDSNPSDDAGLFV